MSSIFKKIKCPNCGAEQFSIIFNSKYKKNISKNELLDVYSSSSDTELLDQLVLCDKCDLVYVNPQVSPDIIFKSYSSNIDPTFVDQNKYRIITFDRVFRDIIKKISIKPTYKKIILDIGCAGGAFPVAANKIGFSVIGVEPSKWLAENAKKQYALDIRAGDLFSQKFRPETFDIISLWDVIEHLTDPSAVLKEIQKISKKNSYLIVNYPNFNSLARKIFRKKWPFFLSVHLIYFTPNTIKEFLKKFDYEIIYTKPHWQTLELGYIFTRAEKYFPIFKHLSKFITFCRLDKFPILYNIGQNLIVARKK